MLLRWFEHSRVYRPSREMEATGAELQRPFEDLFLKAADGVEVNAWFYPANAGSTRANSVVLLCHGNGGNISHRLDLFRTLLESGVNLLALDYRGYGRSRGKPGEEGTYLDAQAAYGRLRAKGFLGENIIAYGESLGGGIVSELALRETLGGLILQNTFTRIMDIGAELYPWLPVRRINRIKYCTCDKLPRIRIPLLFLHSREDGLVRFHHAEKNFAAANEPKLFVELRGDHNEEFWKQPAFRGAIEKLLALIGQPALK